MRLWSLETTQGSETPADREVGQFTHSEEVLCLTLTSDSRYLITGSKDCSLKMWQLDNRKLVQVMAGHNDHVTAVACTSAVTSSTTVPSSPASQTKWLTVVSGSRDRQLIVWDAVTGSEIHTLDGHRSSINCLRVSGDGTVVVSGMSFSLMFPSINTLYFLISPLQIHFLNKLFCLLKFHIG